MTKQTPFYQKHIDLAAKMVEFAGWNMPISYSGVIEEHNGVRSAAGLFDVSHMGEIVIKGPGAVRLLQRIVVSDISRMQDGQVLYSLMCLPSGGIVDDLLIYRFSDDHFMLCVNASNITKDFNWITKHANAGADIRDISEETAMLAVQGQKAEEILGCLCGLDLSTINYYEFQTGTIKETVSLISRTGYTGEDGFELYFNAKGAESIWTAIMEAGKGYGILPVGLAARDTLRLEMKYPLYGNDMTETTTPIEAGLSWTVGFDKNEFIGKDILVKQKNNGVSRKLIGFEMIDKGIPRPHYAIYRREEKIGEVTSGTYSPSLNKGIGAGYIKTEYAETGSEIEIEIRKRRIKACVVKTPFYPGRVKKGNSSDTKTLRH